VVKNPRSCNTRQNPDYPHIDDIYPHHGKAAITEEHPLDDKDKSKDKDSRKGGSEHNGSEGGTIMCPLVPQGIGMLTAWIAKIPAARMATSGIFSSESSFLAHRRERAMKIRAMIQYTAAWGSGINASGICMRSPIHNKLNIRMNSYLKKIIIDKMAYSCTDQYSKTGYIFGFFIIRPSNTPGRSMSPYSRISAFTEGSFIP